MSKKEHLIREIEEWANRAAGEDPATHKVITAKAAIAVIEDLDSDVLADEDG